MALEPQWQNKESSKSHAREVPSDQAAYVMVQTMPGAAHQHPGFRIQMQSSQVVGTLPAAHPVPAPPLVPRPLLRLPMLARRAGLVSGSGLSPGGLTDKRARRRRKEKEERSRGGIELARGFGGRCPCGTVAPCPKRRRAWRADGTGAAAVDPPS